MLSCHPLPVICWHPPVFTVVRCLLPVIPPCLHSCLLSPPSSSAPPSTPASTDSQVGWWCCDVVVAHCLLWSLAAMVGATLLCCCRCPEMVPIATLQAEARSSDTGDGWGAARAQVHCMVARRHHLQKITKKRIISKRNKIKQKKTYSTAQTMLVIIWAVCIAFVH